jgi:NDP-4-keto-2,6-dideoxyhexose 3-C-methyltransferase
MQVKARETCRICGSNTLTPILSLGEQFVINFVDDPKEKFASGPLELVLCNVKNGGCGLLQLKHTVERDVLYTKYWYRSGISKMMVKALADVASCGEKLAKLRVGDLVIDIGANDGTLLRQYKTRGLKTVGFEPSDLWELGTKGTTKIINDYFNHAAFQKEFGDKKAKLITSISMFYDLEDPNAFVEDIKKCLHQDGVWIIQMNYLGLMLENNTFDNICHEHLEYYSLLSLSNLLERHDMKAFDVELNDVNGGSFRIYVKHKESRIQGFPGNEERLEKQKKYEEKMGFDDCRVYDKFAQRIEKTKTDLVEFLQQEVKKGKKIFIYGASTRGLVVLQYAEIDNRLIKAATDMNQEKWRKYIVGTGIPIIPIEQYRKEKPDYLFVLPYHFIEEIKEQEKEFLKKGGKMIVAIPKFEIISDGNC